jgi:hypothetical protein
MDKARARLGVPEARCFAEAAEGFVGVAGDALAGFVAGAEGGHGAGVADDDDGVKIFGGGGRWREIEFAGLGDGDLELVEAAVGAEMGSDGEAGEIVVAAGAGC